MPDIPLNELQEQVTRKQMIADLNAVLLQSDAMHTWTSGSRYGMTFTMDLSIANPAHARRELADLLRSAAESLEG